MDKDKIEKEGWKLGTVSSGVHLRRWIEEYEEMDFEVYLDKIDVSAEKKDDAGCGAKCTICYQNSGEPPYRLYVRERHPESEQSLGKSNGNS